MNIPKISNNFAFKANVKIDPKISSKYLAKLGATEKDIYLLRMAKYWLSANISKDYHNPYANMTISIQEDKDDDYPHATAQYLEIKSDSTHKAHRAKICSKNHKITPSLEQAIEKLQLEILEAEKPYLNYEHEKGKALKEHEIFNILV